MKKECEECKNIMGRSTWKHMEAHGIKPEFEVDLHKNLSRSHNSLDLIILWLYLFLSKMDVELMESLSKAYAIIFKEMIGAVMSKHCLGCQTDNPSQKK